MKIVYPAKFEADEDSRILVTFRDLPEATTDGANMDEARREAADLLDSALMFRMKYREDIPAPSKLRKGEELVVPDAAAAMKVASRQRHIPEVNGPDIIGAVYLSGGLRMVSPLPGQYIVAWTHSGLSK